MPEAPAINPCCPHLLLTELSRISREASDVVVNGKPSCQENRKTLGEFEPINPQVYNYLQTSHVQCLKEDE